MARNSKFSSLACSLCEKICDACATECAKHFDDKDCQKCAETCKKCVEECKKIE